MNEPLHGSEKFWRFESDDFYKLHSYKKSIYFSKHLFCHLPGYEQGTL